MATALAFNGINMQTSSVVIINIKHEDMPDNISEIFKLYNSTKNVVPYPDQFNPKTITLEGQLNATTLAGLDTVADNLRGQFTGVNKTLDIGYAGSTRRYVIAKVNKCAIDRPYNLLFATFSVELITQSLGQNTTFTTLVNQTGRTLGYYADSVTFTGNAPYQQAVFTITYSAISGAATNTVNIGNDSNGQTITVTRAWAAGDVLVVDSSNQSVQVNGTDVIFTGGFPEFPAGMGVIAYSDDFTSRTLASNVKCKALWF